MDTDRFAELLTLIEDRSAAFRAAASLAEPAAAVPTCPGWSVHDLVTHLGQVHLFWAAAVRAGPAESPPADVEIPDQVPDGELLAWSAECAGALLGALGEAGSERGCWTWWARSGAPRTAGAVARHQVQEAAVHAYDAERAVGPGRAAGVAAGVAGPLPLAVATDGVDEFLSVVLAQGSWPFPPASVAFTAAEGGYWLVGLSEAGVAVRRRSPGSEHPGSERSSPGQAGSSVVVDGPAASVSASASDLVLHLYGREPAGPVRVDGDEDLVERLLRWASTD